MISPCFIETESSKSALMEKEETMLFVVIAIALVSLMLSIGMMCQTRQLAFHLKSQIA